MKNLFSKNMAKDKLAELLKKEATTIVDVRNLDEFDEGHIDGSINIPLGIIETRLEQVASLSKPLVLCCKSGNRSNMATMLLKQNGIEEVFNGGGWEHVKSCK